MTLVHNFGFIQSTAVLKNDELRMQPCPLFIFTEIIFFHEFHLTTVSFSQLADISRKSSLVLRMNKISVFSLPSFCHVSLGRKSSLFMAATLKLTVLYRGFLRLKPFSPALFSLISSRLLTTALQLPQATLGAKFP